MSGKVIVGILLTVLFVAAGEPAAGGEIAYRIVPLDEAKEIYSAHRALFIDARPFERYRRGTIMGALNVPLKRFKRMKKWLPGRKDAPILVFCNGVKCGKSKRLAKKLAKAGYRRLLVYEGGYPEWKSRGLPIMAAPKPCRCDDGVYKPSQPVTVEGVSLYRDPEEPNRIDARWIAPQLERGEIPAGLHLVDVRPAEQYRTGHLSGAVNLPYDPEKKRLDTGKLPPEGPILFTCNHGSISADAWFSLPQELQQRSFILDATVKCEGKKCEVSPN
jgi:rhodanese-related sulfurtransferase